MSKKLFLVLLTMAAIFALNVDLYAGAEVRWAGNYAGTVAATYVPGATGGSATPPMICRDMHGGAVPPAVSSICWASRTPFTDGGAWAYAYANNLAGRRYSIAASGTWGGGTYAGKAAGDTTRCSTYVEIIASSETIDLVVYSYLETMTEVNRLATCELKATAQGHTLFQGAIKFPGHQEATLLEGQFIDAPIEYGEGTATINHVFPGISTGGYDPDSVVILLTTDTMRHGPIPSMTIYGILILAILLLVAGVVLYRRRQVRRTMA